MKTREEISRRLAHRFDVIWAGELVCHDADAWPYAINVGEPSMRQLEQSYASIERELGDLDRWAQKCGLECRHRKRLVGRVSYRLLSHVVANDVDSLARATGNLGKLQLYRERLRRLREEFPDVSNESLRSVLMTMSRFDVDDVDFDLICRAGIWFAAHDASGYTAREVPLEGFHAKWLDSGSHRQVVSLLCGKDELELKERPRLVRYRYLDADYLARGLRAHDSWVEGDSNGPAYEPDIVLICENRDSALWFPELERGVCVLGDGKAGIATLAHIDWIAHARRLFYWGDMDIEGLEILAKYRESGLCPRSVCMDLESYERYRRYGTNSDARGRQLAGKEAAPLDALTEEENELYMRLCSFDLQGPRRIEQERIPLEAVRKAILNA